MMALLGVDLATYVRLAFEALEGDGEDLGFAGCEGGDWLWGGHFCGMLLFLYGWLGVMR